jgi:charged multivesicular body protein 1
MGAGKSMEDEVMDLRIEAKMLVRESEKCAKLEKMERLKMKTAMEKGLQDVARIHAENAIRQKNQSLNFLKLGSRMDAISQRMMGAVKMNKLTKTMGNVTAQMSRAIKSMNVEQISKTMDQFEKNFEELDVQSAVMDESMQAITGNVIPEDQVDSLMRQVADEHGLEVSDRMGEIVVPRGQPVPAAQPARQQVREEDDLERRLNELKGV